MQINLIKFNENEKNFLKNKKNIDNKKRMKINCIRNV